MWKINWSGKDLKTERLARMKLLLESKEETEEVGKVEAKSTEERVEQQWAKG